MVEGGICIDGGTSGVVSDVCGENGSVVTPIEIENVMTTLPPSDKSEQQEKAACSAVEVKKGEQNKCFMENGVCKTHNCEVLKVKTKVKRWAYLEKKKQYGFKHSTAVRLICKSGGSSESDVGRSQYSQAVGISSLGSRKGKVKTEFYWMMR